MIKYNNNTINDWNFGDDNIIKVYKHGAVVFYKFDSEQGGYKVCYAVVDDITQYTDTEFEDVYDKATEKWFKLNNLNQYEEYGVYGSGRTITTYEGKLTIDGDYEYQYSGGSWVNIGEVSGSSRVPGGYVELTHVQTIKQDVSNASAFTVPIDIQSSYNYIIEFMPLEWSSNGNYYGDILGNDGDTNFPSYGLFKLDTGWGTEWNRTIASFWNYSFDTRGGKPAYSKYRFYDNTKARVTMHLHNYDAAQGADMIVENEGYPTSAITSTSAQKSGYVVSTGVYNSPLFCTQTNNMITTAYMNFYNLKIETNENVAVYDYIPCKRKSDNKVGLYDVVHNVFHAPLFKLNAGDEASHTEYPKYYSEKSEPLDNLTFNTLAEAQAYAEANCVYVGLKATINGDKYVFSGDSQSGYEWVEQSYTQYEYIRTSNPAYYTIDTGFYPTTANTIEVKFEMVESVDWGNIVAWGVLGNTAHSTSLQFATVTYNYQAIVRTGGNNGASYRATIGENNPTVYTLPLSATSGTYSVNGGPTNTIRYNINSSFNLPSIVSMRILGGYGNDNGDIKNYKSACGKLYYVKVYDGNGNIVKHYVPSDYNGSPCLYEIVDGNYILDTYTGSSHGTLTLGPQV